MKPMPLPPGWAIEPLSQFIQSAQENVYASFVHMQREYQTLSSIDSLFLDVPLSVPPDIEPVYKAQLFVRSHSSYRTGCQLAMSGQNAECFSILRGCLEFALYALRMHGDKSIVGTWARQEDKPESKQQAKRAFQAVKLFEKLKAIDPELETTIRKLYDRTIDFGGHPTERSISSNQKLERRKTSIRVQQAQLNPTPLNVAHCMKTAAQIGCGSLSIFAHIYADKFKAKGMTEKLNQLRASL